MDAIKGGLNLTGLFLENIVFTSLLRHPEIKARREEPYSGYTSEGFEGTIDILAASMVNSGTAICLSIECKRANPEQKHWIFERRDNSSDPESYPFDYRTHSGQISYEMNIFFPSLGYDGMKFFDKAIQVFEFKEIGGVLSRNQTEKAFNAVLQSNEATSSFIDEKDRVNILLENNGKQMNTLFLSVVVTTANLWLTDYSPTNVSWKDGTIPIDKLNLIPKDWVIFEFPLPYSLRTRPIGGGVGPVKRPTFIVNSEKFGDFIPKLLNDCKRYIFTP